MNVFISMLPLILKIVDFLLDRSNASKETKERFYAMVAQAYADKIISVEAHDAFMKQKELLNKGT